MGGVSITSYWTTARIFCEAERNSNKPTAYTHQQEILPLPNVINEKVMHLTSNCAKYQLTDAATCGKDRLTCRIKKS